MNNRRLSRLDQLLQAAQQQKTTDITLSPKPVNAMTIREVSTTARVVLCAKKLQNHKKPLFQNRSLAGAPINASYEQVSILGTPDDANCMERVRDAALSFFVRFSTLFNTLAILAVCGMSFFGVLILYAMVDVLFGVHTGDWSLLLPQCVNLTGVTSPATSSELPTINGTVPPGIDHCTINQMWFAACIKAFNFFFSYINMMPIVWRLSILANAVCGRPGVNDELVDGVDFYNRPTEALWFHIPRRKRRWIAVLLNLAWAFHFVAMAMHIRYWSYAQGSTLPGNVLQNVPFALSALCSIAAGVLQTRSEQAVIAAQPDRFPPPPLDYVKDAYRRWRAAGGHGGRSRRCASWCGGVCAVCSPSFLALLREEVRHYKAERATSETKTLSLSGVTVRRQPSKSGGDSPLLSRQSSRSSRQPTCTPEDASTRLSSATERSSTGAADGAQRCSPGAPSPAGRPQRRNELAIRV